MTLTPFKIPFIRPNFPRSIEIAQDIDEIVQSNRFTNFGPKENKFSKSLADYLGQGLHVASLANGTLALLAAIHCTMGLERSGRYLLMPSFTFAAVPQAAIWSGYTPWFVDIDRLSWQASPQCAREVLEAQRDRIAGILLTNAFGIGTPHIAEWERLAAEWELPMVIDSAAGFGSKYEDGQKLGARGLCEVFSFHATKPFAIGEGGALASRDDRITDTAHEFQNFGFDSARLCNQLGINGKLSEINAAIGLRQLVDLDQRLASRHTTFQRYREELGSFGLGFQKNAENSTHPHMSILCESPTQKRAVLQSLRNNSIEGRDYYNPPLHLHPYFLEDSGRSAFADLKETEEVSSRIVSLPVHDNMPLADVDLVIHAVKIGIWA